MKVSPHYLGAAGQSYASARLAQKDLTGHSINLAYFLPYLRPTDVVLDFGCGEGGMLRLLRERVARAEGLEVNPAVRGIAQASGATVYGGLDEIPEGTAYDVVVSNHVLEHVRDVCGTLEALRERIRPGGLFVTKLPLEDFRSRSARSWTRDDVDHHLQTWTPRLFGNVLFESGFEVRECRVVTSAWDRRLFPLMRVGLASLGFWAMAVLLRRRQLFAVAQRPHDLAG